MLLLTRKPSEVIYIEDKDTGKVITLLVAEVRGQTVKLGLEDESQQYVFLRKEVKERKEGKENPNPYYNDKPLPRPVKKRAPRFNMDIPGEDS